MAPGQARVVEQGQRVVETVGFRGHPMVLALHPTTIEITTEASLTRRGDCIVGVGSRVGCSGLGDAIRKALMRDEARVVLRLVVGTGTFVVTARGDRRLTLTHPHDMVIRKSDFVSDRTLAVGASAAAKDIPRSMVRALRSKETTGHLEIEVT